MAYNYFPTNYQPIYPQQNYSVQVPANTQPSIQSSLIWVSGETGAKAYMVAPNQTVVLWDSEQNCIYIKSADNSGMPTIKILDYSIRENNSPKDTGETIKFATKEDVSKEIKRLEEMIRKIKKPNASSEQAR